MPYRFTWNPRVGQSEPGSALRLVLWLVVLLAVGGLAWPTSARAQTSSSDDATLIDRYQTARRHALAQRFLQRGQGVRVRPPMTLSTSVDSLRRVGGKKAGERRKMRAFPLHDSDLMQRLERGWFEETFGDTRWSFLGAGTHRTFFDTTRTQELRARLQAHFGDPTQTLGDANPREVKGDRAQFEYWFVVNDSIPVRVTDASGPLDRGLIVMTDRRYRDRILALRDTLLGALRQPKRAPYVDYYYDDLVERWYRTGFDGEAYFLERISPFDIVPGRRARHIAPVDSSASSTSEADSSS